MSTTPRAPQSLRRTLGSPILFAIVYASLAGTLYFSLGVIGGRALGLTPFVFLFAAVLFALATMTYVEGASLHQDRAGSTVFARYAFNELVSFLAGWAVILDYIILVAVASFSAAHYAAAFWPALGHGEGELVFSLGIVAVIALGTIRGFSARRAERLIALVIIDLALMLFVIVAGLIEFFDWHRIISPVDLGTSPTWGDTFFALGIAAVVATGLESASGLAGEVAVGRRGLRRLVVSSTLTVAVVFVGIGVVALCALPVMGGETSLSRNFLEAPVLGIAQSFSPHWLATGLKYVVAGAATVTLFEAAASAMLGLSRLAYSLSTNRQIPSALGRLHPTRSTPFVVITIAAVMAGVLASFQDLDLLVGIYAFGALLGLTIAHLSVVVLRFREPNRDRPYRMPFSIGRLPVPAALGAVLSALAWVSVVVLHEGARYVGLGWMAFGVTTYVIYRLTQDKSLTKRVTVPESALKGAEKVEVEYGSILVPIMGTPLDDDIVQTAGRLAGDEHDDFDDERGATIEALWVFEVPMSLPIDARLPDAQLERARTALRRAKAVGEEYEGVEVATATVRARRAGHAIVEEARRRGVEAIVLAAEEPSRIRGGALLGGRAGARDNFVGDVTKYVVSKAPCQVILTAPPANDAR